MTKVIVLLCALLATAAPSASAQDSPAREGPERPRQVTLYELALRDGSRLYGEVLREDEAVVVFRTQGGTTVTAPVGEILSIRRVTGTLTRGEFQPADPNTTRLFFGPTGRSLKRGQAYLGMYEFMAPFVQVGVTDRISVGGGTPLVFAGSESGPPFWITPKIQLLAGERTQIAAGAFHGVLPGEDYGGIAYLVGTHGTTASSFTAGAGLAYSQGGDRAGVVMLGGDVQFRRNMKFITENYIWQGGHAMVTAGVRFFGDHLSADLALAVPITEGFFVGPVVNFVRVF